MLLHLKSYKIAFEKKLFHFLETEYFYLSFVIVLNIGKVNTLSKPWHNSAK